MGMSTRRHERIHARIARRLGHSARIDLRPGRSSDGTEYLARTILTGNDKPSGIELAAIALGPHVHGDAGQYCRSDLAAAQQYIDEEYRRRDRRSAMRAARRIARRQGR